MAPDRAYRDLTALWRERALLESCATLLGWDEETYMPDGGVEARAEQQALLARLEHERATDPRVTDLLAEAEHQRDDDDAVMARNLTLMRRDHEAARRVPASLIEELARQTTRAQGAWETARDEGDPAPYLPALARVVELTCAWADCLRDDGSRYDVCLDEWEPDLTEAEVTRTLDALRAPLAALADRAMGRASAPPPLPPIELDEQRAISEAAAAWLGFDFTCGRLDTAAHPSTMRIGPADVRLTTRYFRELPLRGLLSTLHEVGHGIYDQSLPAEHFGTPVGEASSIVLHESQARLVENIVGRSLGFWRFAAPRFAKIAPGLADVSVDHAVAALRHIARGPNRVHADELTYDLHIAVRVDLERALLRGDLRCADLPAAWDEAYAAVLVRPPDAAEGLLQDGHWAAGMFGYFPTYTLGNVAAAQLWAAAERTLGDLDSALAGGDFAGLMSFLRDAVHRHAGLVPAAELLVRATGAPLDPAAHIARLAQRYG